MILLVHEIKNQAVFQTGKPLRRNLLVKHLRPHLLISGNPVGDLRCEILDSDGREVARSNEIAISSMKTLSHAHGFWRFDIDAHLKKNETYRFAVRGVNGYTFSESDYVGVCKDWDMTKAPLNYVPTNDLEDPLDFEVWHRREKTR